MDKIKHNNLNNKCTNLKIIIFKIIWQISPILSQIWIINQIILKIQDLKIANKLPEILIKMEIWVTMEMWITIFQINQIYFIIIFIL